WRTRGPADAESTGTARPVASDGRPALLWPPDHRGEPADRRVYPAHRARRTEPLAGTGVPLFPAPEDKARRPGRLYLRRRATDVRDRPLADGQPLHDSARRALDGIGAADRGRDFRHC